MLLTSPRPKELAKLFAPPPPPPSGHPHRSTNLSCDSLESLEEILKSQYPSLTLPNFIY